MSSLDNKETTDIIRLAGHNKPKSTNFFERHPEISDYKLLQRCGQGAFGEVWVAEDLTRKKIALKIVWKSSENGEWEKEFRGLSYYQNKVPKHPNLVEIYHIGEEQDFFYYTMELADNIGTEYNYVPKTLATLLEQNGRLDATTVIDIANEILDGVATIHKAGLIHRDIKPANIIFVDGVPMLSDVGLMTSTSFTASIAGTMGFIPPERLSDTKSSSSSKTNADDLYAMGKVLYCAFTGNSPECYPSVPKELLTDSECRKINKIVKIACHGTPYCRFKDAEDFKNALSKNITWEYSVRSFLFNYIIKTPLMPVVWLLRCFVWLWNQVGFRNLLLFLFGLWLWVIGCIFIKDYNGKMTFAGSIERLWLIVTPSLPFVQKYNLCDLFSLEEAERIRQEYGKEEILVSKRKYMSQKLCGQIRNRMNFKFTAGNNDVNETSPDFDYILSRVDPYVLDGTPRQDKIVLKSDFSSDSGWIWHGEGIRYENKKLIFRPGIEGSVKLPDQSLPNEYEISFKTNICEFKGILGFEVVADVFVPDLNKVKNPSKLFSKYFFNIKGDGATVEFMPVMFRDQDFTDDDLIKVCASKAIFNPNDKFYDFKIIMTFNVLRIFCDGNLVYYGPSIFKGGIFGISFKNRGEKPIIFKDFEIHDIKSVKKNTITPEDEFKLPSLVKDIGVSPISKNISER